MRDLLKIQEISYGEFPEISDLNPRFKPESKKIKVTLDVQLPENLGNADLHSLVLKLMQLLPTLEKHQCGEHLFDNLKPDGRTPLSNPRLAACACRSDEITDIAHLMEHVIIDLQSTITGMDSCSGITCGYKNPEYRFDMFVECRDKSVGLFSVFFTMDVLKKLLESKNLPPSVHNLIDLAKHLYKNKSSRNQTTLESWAGHLSKKLGLEQNSVLSLLRKLKEYGFFNHDQALAG